MRIEAKSKWQKAENNLVSRKQMLFEKAFLLLVVFSLFTFPSFSQDSIKKPKIGLVLSGGGAKGLAHIGVLKEIEKAGIKIDYIGGTSMGAIIGGLYASGYTASDLDSIFRGTNFDELLQDFVPRNNKTFYEKQNDEVYALSLPFQHFKISVPRGLSKGLYNYNLISKLTHNVRHIRDFNQLKIPFLCIATNVETGEEVVFNKGSLPLCLVASGAFPSLFAPVEIDGKLYVDGGVANNYPVEEVRKMGADIIIGVDVQDDLKNRNNINGATGVLVQISNFQMIEKMKAKKELTDIYIKPNIEGFSVISFDQSEAIVQKGVEAAQLVKDKLEKLGTNYKPVSENMNRVDSLFVQGIAINGLENYTRSYVLGKLRFKIGTKISYTDLHSGINNLNATQNFSLINYQLVNDDNLDILLLDVKENPIKTYLKFGLHYDDLFKTSALLNVTQKKVLFKNDLASFDFILGDNIRYNLDYYVDNGFHWSFGFKSKLNQFNKTISKTDFNGGEILQALSLKTLNIDYLDITNQAYVQTIFIQKFLIGAGVEHKFMRIFSNTIQNTTKYIDNSNYISLFGFLKYDSFDNKYFPKKGWYFMGDFQSFLSSSDVNNNFEKSSTFKADAAIVQTFFKKISVKVQTEGGFLAGESSSHIFDFVLGGYGFAKTNNFRPFFGYDFLELAGDSYVKGSVTLDYELLKKHHVNFAANYSNIGNNIFENKNWIAHPRYSGYALGYGMETLLGPIELKHSWSPETGKHYTWFTVGFWF
ncbi:patatin-like phospholipase family protein [Flavobacterium sp.]|uniref:patatin-like phospholipase family protein n=1 Tax=Flavobacterium sp. TaxID=239 RepID=UPI002615C49F|nr:patatin-like phospholipase family protein [Flavobacterium sp.]